MVLFDSLIFKIRNENYFNSSWLFILFRSVILFSVSLLEGFTDEPDNILLPVYFTYLQLLMFKFVLSPP